MTSILGVVVTPKKYSQFIYETFEFGIILKDIEFIETSEFYEENVLVYQLVTWNAKLKKPIKKVGRRFTDRTKFVKYAKIMLMLLQ